MEAISPTSSNESVEIGDYLVCTHGTEKCETCNVDFREDNSFTAGLEPIEDREPLEVEYTYNKDGVAQCKKHKATMCNQCLNFKKMLTKVGKDHAKKARGAKGSTSNF